MPPFNPLVLAVCCALLLGAVATGTWTLLIVVLVAQAGFLAAAALDRNAAGRSNLLLAAGGCLAADGVVLLQSGVERADERSAAWVAGLLGVAVVLAFGVQLARRDGRAGLAESLAAGVAALLVGSSGAGWLRLADAAGWRSILPMLTGMVAAAVVSVWPRPGAVRSAVAVVGGLVAGVLVAAPAGLEVAPAVAAGAVGALCSLAGHALIPAARNSRVALGVGSTVPVLLAGPLMWGLLRSSGG